MWGIAKEWVRWFIKKWFADEHWKECTDCWIYKTRNQYHRCSAMKSDKRTPNCKDCRNKRKRDYRKHATTDNIYKSRTRRLQIWSVWYIKGAEISDLCTFGMKLTRKVTEYVYRKWYRLECNEIKMNKRINTSIKTFIYL